MKSKMLLLLGKHEQRHFCQKYSNSKIVDINFAELKKISTDAFFNEPDITNRSFILFGRKPRVNEGMEQVLEL